MTQQSNFKQRHQRKGINTEFIKVIEITVIQSDLIFSKFSGTSQN